MQHPNFQPGDRVVHSIYGAGTVMRMDADVGDMIPVCYDREMGGHNLGGLCEMGHGWVSSASFLRPTDDRAESPMSAPPMDPAVLF